MRHIPAILALIVLVMLPAFASVETTVFDFSYRISEATDVMGMHVDWVRKVVLITTKEEAPARLVGVIAREAARDRALESARATFAAYVEQMHLTAYASVGNAIYTGYLPQKLQGLLGKGIQPVVERWDSESRTITLVSAVPLCGADSPNALASRMLKIEQDAFAKQDADKVQWYTKPVPAKAQPVETQVQPVANAPYTGIILDCTNMHYIPVLLPKLISKNGTVLWGLLERSPAEVIKQGMMGYATSLQDAMTTAGTHPCIFRPQATCGPLQGDLLLNEKDAWQLADMLAVSRGGDKHLAHYVITATGTGSITATLTAHPGDNTSGIMRSGALLTLTGPRKPSTNGQAPLTTTTANFPITADSVTISVADAGAFAAGQSIMISDGPLPVVTLID